MMRAGLVGVVSLLLAAGAPALAGAEPCTEPLPAIFERLAPAVVSVNATKVHKAPPQRRFETIVGSGIVIDRDGHVLTNAHVVDGAASLSVKLDRGDRAPARLVGLDPVLDVALIRLEARSPTVTARLGDSATVRVGDDVVVIGTAVGLEQTMTRGIVSGLDRLLPGLPDQPMIQTDAAINFGNSGGPLVDRCGTVVGITTLVSEEAQGVGFAVPINAIKAALRDLRDMGRVVRPWLGIQGRAIDPALGALFRLPLTPGYLVEVVYDGSPADRAGIRGGHLSVVVQGEDYLLGGDIITAVGGQPVRSHEDYLARVRALRPGQRARVTVFRDGQTRDLTLTVAERPRLPFDLAD
jgi:serine protease Do